MMPSAARTKSLNRIKKTSIEAALSAGKVLKKYFRKTLNIREKPGAGLVTQADLQAEATVIKILKKSFPSFSFLAEESGSTASSNATANPEGRWIIDPLDGTTNFVHGYPMFCVSIGCEWEGELVAGVIYHPILDELYVAVQNQGATKNKKPIFVSKTNKFEDALFTTGFFTYRKEPTLIHEDMVMFEKMSGLTRGIRRPGSAALDLAYTASGVFEGFWEKNLSAWDIAAGAVLVREAGGLVSGFDGKPLILATGNVVASNKVLHLPLISELSK